MESLEIAISKWGSVFWILIGFSSHQRIKQRPVCCLLSLATSEPQERLFKDRAPHRDSKLFSRYVWTPLPAPAGGFPYFHLHSPTLGVAVYTFLERNDLSPTLSPLSCGADIDPQLTPRVSTPPISTTPTHSYTVSDGGISTGTSWTK